MNVGIYKSRRNGHIRGIENIIGDFVYIGSHFLHVLFANKNVGFKKLFSVEYPTAFY